MLNRRKKHPARRALIQVSEDCASVVPDLEFNACSAVYTFMSLRYCIHNLSMRKIISR